MKPSAFLEFFIKHRTAANLLMLLMIAIGMMSLSNLNRQFFPNFSIEIVGVSVQWTGATAEDVDANIVQLLESELRSISNVKKVLSTSYEGLAAIQVEFEFGTDMQQALADVETAVGQVISPKKPKPPRWSRASFMMISANWLFQGLLTCLPYVAWPRISKKTCKDLALIKLN